MRHFQVSKWTLRCSSWCIFSFIRFSAYEPELVEESRGSSVSEEFQMQGAQNVHKFLKTMLSFSLHQKEQEPQNSISMCKGNYRPSEHLVFLFVEQACANNI